MRVKPGTSPVNFEELRAESQRCLLGFLNAEVQLGFTFVEAAAYQRDLGHLEHSQHSKTEAERAIASISHFLDRIADPEIRDAFAGRRSELDRACAAL